MYGTFVNLAVLWTRTARRDFYQFSVATTASLPTQNNGALEADMTKQVWQSILLLTYPEDS